MKKYSSLFTLLHQYNKQCVWCWSGRKSCIYLHQKWPFLILRTLERQTIIYLSNSSFYLKFATSVFLVADKNYDCKMFPVRKFLCEMSFDCDPGVLLPDNFHVGLF